MRLFVDNLTNLDFSYLHPTRGIVGETWLASIELIGELDPQGMICDFGIVKKMMREWLDTEIDHRLLIPTKAAELMHVNKNECIKVRWENRATNELYFVEAPREAITLVEQGSITPDSLANWSLSHLKNLFPSSVKEIRLRFTSESIEGPYYHYSHGLKKHDGNCQRIAHGHRSKIEIWKNNKLDEALMDQWANKWRDIYIGTREDLIPDTENFPEKNSTFSYTSAQGYFLLSLPTSRCCVINSDTTVELLAKHIAEQVKKTDPTSHFIVKAYEGLSKGAIVEL